MTEPREDWNDPGRVGRWVAKDARRHAVQTARDLAAATVAVESAPALVLELAAGSGTFLATFLSAFPQARGVWSDSSPEMVRYARETLAPFPGRVGYVLSDLRSPGISGGAAPDVLICARATHGLDAGELTAFYRRAAVLLRPGGWLVNLDHMACGKTWSRRYDALGPRFYDGGAGTPSAGKAKKDRGGHRLETHVELLAAAGFADVDTPWRLLSTVLLMARRPD